MPEAREIAAIRHPAEAHFRLLVDAMTDDAVVLLDPDGRASTWNTGAERVTGRGAEQVIGRPVSWFYPDEDVQAGRPRQDLRDAEVRGRIEGEGWRCRGDGTRFWASVVITALRTATLR